MRGPRLTRSKTSDAASARNDYSRPTDGLTFKTSFDDLRSPDGRQKLREQLSSQFPESYTSSLKSSPSAVDMAGREWLSVGQNAAAKSSSSSVESAGYGGPKRLSAVPEKNMAAIDVEQAIHLLTELKKTATPDQLVALHKALLPTRDSIISNADSSGGPRGSLIRQKSMLPAGLATRGGASDDLLKRQEEVQPVVKKRKSGPSVNGHHRLHSKSSIAALDLADDAANLLPSQRAETPNDQQQQYFGAYRPGTLRITNGAASPEPSQRPRTSGEASSVAASKEQITSRGRSGSAAKTFTDPRSIHEIALDDLKQRIESNTGEGAAIASPSRQRDPSQSRQYRSQRSQEPLQANAAASSNRSREPSLSRPPVAVETKASKQSLSANKKASSDTLARRSLDFSRRSTESIRKSIDDGRVSPVDAPRFAQRWSHRASQISHEYMTECDVPISPFADKQDASAIASAFAQRLSTVYDREDAENTANETPEAALSRLEGKADPPVESKASGKSRVRQNSYHSEERLSLRATAVGLNAVRPKPVSVQSDPRPMPKKADSGYVSDASHRSLQPKVSQEARPSFAEAPATPEQPYEQPGYREIMHRIDPNAADGQSLYTLEQMLKMSGAQSQSTPSTPSRPDNARKHSSFLKITGLKKSNLSASKTTLDLNSSADSLPLPAELCGSSPAESKAPKPTKKLQKRMPDDVRKQRRMEREKAQQSSLTLAGQDLDAVGVPTDLSELASSPAPASELATRSTTTLASSPLATRKDSTPAEALSELIGSSQQPAELDTDESATAPRRSLSRKQSKKSKRRSRQNTATTADAEDKSEPSRKRSFSLSRKRSKSKRRSGSLTPKRRSMEPAVPSIAALSARFEEDDSQEGFPLYCDTGSVARALGTNPYDISTGMFQKGKHNEGPLINQLQSPHQISTSFSRSKTGGFRGMDDSMARELARMKSRDVAIQNNEDVYDRPRMATPSKRSQQVFARTRSMMPNAFMVEQRRPGFEAKPVFQRASFESLGEGAKQRPHSIAESIPSLPELPVDAETRAAKAAEYLARRDREVLRPEPVLADSPSPAAFLTSAASPNAESSEHPGFSNESVADAVAKAMKARRAKYKEGAEQGQQSDRLRLGGPRMNSNASGSSGKVSLQIHGIPERQLSDASEARVIGADSHKYDATVRSKTAPPQDDEGGPSVWERQAQLWRQRRESVGKTLGQPVDEEAVMETEQPAASPAVMVPSPSRTTTPSARDSLPSAQRRRKSASEQANAYRDLIGSANEPFDEAPPRPPNRASTDTITHRSTTDPAVPDSAPPPAKAYMHHAIPIHRSRSPGGRVRTPSGSYHPYSPTYAAQALNSRSAQSLDVQRPRVPGHQQTDTLESIVGRYDRSLTPVPGSEAASVVGESPARGAAGSMVDRYGGGLQFGFERGVGVKGSSGLGVAGSARGREGGGFSERFGVDLGDVPVFLRRAG